MSFKPVVKTGSDPKWYDNALRFATYAEAEASAKDIYSRWTLAVEWRVAESTDPVNYEIVDGVIRPVAHGERQLLAEGSF